MLALGDITITSALGVRQSGMGNTTEDVGDDVVDKTQPSASTRKPFRTGVWSVTMTTRWCGLTCV